MSHELQRPPIPFARPSAPPSARRLVVAALAAVGALGAFGACGSGQAPLGSTPLDRRVDFDAVYVVNGGDGSISVLHAADDVEVGTIGLEGAERPHHVSLSHDRRWLAVAFPGVDLSGGHTEHGGGHGGGHEVRGAVIVLDAASGATLSTARVDGSNHNAAYGPAGTIWTAIASTPGRVLLLDGTTLAERGATEVGDGPSEVTFAPSGRYAFVANTASDDVTVLDATNGAIVKTIPVGDAPVGAWPVGDDRMVVDNEAGQSLTVIDADTLEVVRTISLGFTPALAARPPGRDELWVTDPHAGRVVLLDPDDGTPIAAFDSGAGAHAMAFSPDGAKGWVTNQAAGTVSVVDVAARRVTATIPVGDLPNGLLYRARL